MPEPGPPPVEGRAGEPRDLCPAPVVQTEKLEPQPQELEAFGFETLK